MRPSQIRVFDGLRLTTEHLDHLQAALRSGVQDIRAALGLGVVYRGFEVVPAGDAAVTVQPGLAVDFQNNRMVLDEPQTVPVSLPPGEAAAFVCLKYDAVEGGQVEGKYTLVWDSCSVVVRPALPDAKDNLVALARVSRAADGRLVVDPPTARPAEESAAPTAGAEAPTAPAAGVGEGAGGGGPRPGEAPGGAGTGAAPAGTAPGESGAAANGGPAASAQAAPGNGGASQAPVDASAGGTTSGNGGGTAEPAGAAATGTSPANGGGTPQPPAAAPGSGTTPANGGATAQPAGAPGSSPAPSNGSGTARPAGRSGAGEGSTPAGNGDGAQPARTAPGGGAVPVTAAMPAAPRRWPVRQGVERLGSAPGAEVDLAGLLVGPLRNSLTARGATGADVRFNLSETEVAAGFAVASLTCYSTLSATVGLAAAQSPPPPATATTPVPRAAPPPSLRLPANGLSATRPQESPPSAPGPTGTGAGGEGTPSRPEARATAQGEVTFGPDAPAVSQFGMSTVVIDGAAGAVTVLTEGGVAHLPLGVPGVGPAPGPGTMDGLLQHLQLILRVDAAGEAGFKLACSLAWSGAASEDDIALLQSAKPSLSWSASVAWKALGAP